MELILIILGLLFTGVDIYIGGKSYPVYEKSLELGEKIQEYVTHYIVSDHLKIDVLSDFIGCILLFVGVYMFLKYSKGFVTGQLFLCITAILSVVLRIIPFFLNGKEMIIAVLILFFLQIASELYTEFIIVYTLVSISNEVSNRATNTRMQFGWWITVFCRIFITFLTFVGHIKVANVYKVVLIPATLFTLYQMYKIKKYIGTTEGSYRMWKEKLLK